MRPGGLVLTSLEEKIARLLPHEQREVEDFVDYLLTRAIQGLQSNKSAGHDSVTSSIRESDFIPAFKEPEVLKSSFEVKIPEKQTTEEETVLDWIL